jgi:hypothetical protein
MVNKWGLSDYQRSMFQQQLSDITNKVLTGATPPPSYEEAKRRIREVSTEIEMHSYVEEPIRKRPRTFSWGKKSFEKVVS